MRLRIFFIHEVKHDKWEWWQKTCYMWKPLMLELSSVSGHDDIYFDLWCTTLLCCGHYHKTLNFFTEPVVYITTLLFEEMLNCWWYFKRVLVWHIRYSILLVDSAVIGAVLKLRSRFPWVMFHKYETLFKKLPRL